MKSSDREKAGRRCSSALHSIPHKQLRSSPRPHRPSEHSFFFYLMGEQVWKGDERTAVFSSMLINPVYEEMIREKLNVE